VVAHDAEEAKDAAEQKLTALEKVLQEREEFLAVNSVTMAGLQAALQKEQTDVVAKQRSLDEAEDKYRALEMRMAAAEGFRRKQEVAAVVQSIGRASVLQAAWAQGSERQTELGTIQEDLSIGGDKLAASQHEALANERKSMEHAQTAAADMSQAYEVAMDHVKEVEKTNRALEAKLAYFEKLLQEKDGHASPKSNDPAAVLQSALVEDEAKNASPEHGSLAVDICLPADEAASLGMMAEMGQCAVDIADGISGHAVQVEADLVEDEHRGRHVELDSAEVLQTPSSSSDHAQPGDSNVDGEETLAPADVDAVPSDLAEQPVTAQPAEVSGIGVEAGMSSEVTEHIVRLTCAEDAAADNMELLDEPKAASEASPELPYRGHAGGLPEGKDAWGWEPEVPGLPVKATKPALSMEVEDAVGLKASVPPASYEDPVKAHQVDLRAGVDDARPALPPTALGHAPGGDSPTAESEAREAVKATLLNLERAETHPASKDSPRGHAAGDLPSPVHALSGVLSGVPEVDEALVPAATDVSQGRQELDDTTASCNIFNERASQEAVKLAEERQHVEHAETQNVVVAKDCESALERVQKAKDTKRILGERLLAAEQVLEEKRMPVAADSKPSVRFTDDPEIRKVLASTGVIHEAVRRAEDDLQHARAADDAARECCAAATSELAEGRRQAAEARAGYSLASASFAGALERLKEAEDERAGLEDRLASVRALLGESEDGKPPQEKEERPAGVSSPDDELEAELFREQACRAELEGRSADMSTKQGDLEREVHAAVASNEQLREQLLRKKSELDVAKAASDEIREHARQLADDVTLSVVHGEAEPVEEHQQQQQQRSQGNAPQPEPEKECLKPPLPVSQPLRMPVKSASVPSRGHMSPKTHASSKKTRKASKSSPAPGRRTAKPHHSGSGSTPRLAGARPEPQAVTSILKLKNVDYAELSSDPAMLSSFKDAMKMTIASAAGPGILPEHVELTLSAGSVVVKATITPPSEVPVAIVATNLKASPLQKSAAATVAKLDKIETVTKGPIWVDEFRVLAVEMPQFGPSPKEQKRSSSRPSGREGKSQREKESRRMRRALEDAIVLASRIQLLRAEGARTRKKITQASEKKQQLALASQRARACRGMSGWPTAADIAAAAQPAQPELAAVLALRTRLAGTRATLTSCNALLRAELHAAVARQVLPCARQPSPQLPQATGMPEVAAVLALQAKMAASKESMITFNAALRTEMQQLTQDFARLQSRHRALKQQVQAGSE